MPVGAHLSAKMGQVRAKMALCWPTWRQDVPRMANLELTWRAFGCILASFFYLGRDLFKIGENQKNDDCSSLLKVFLNLGPLSEAMLAHLGAMLGRLGAILEQLGDKMWTESAKMSQDSGQERQDEARWRKWAARERNGEGQGGSDRRRPPRPGGGVPP